MRKVFSSVLITIKILPFFLLLPFFCAKSFKIVLKKSFTLNVFNDEQKFHLILSAKNPSNPRSDEVEHDEH